VLVVWPNRSHVSQMPNSSRCNPRWWTWRTWTRWWCDAATSWCRTPWQANNKKTKTVSGLTWLWCGTCGYWNTGATIGHLTEDHQVKGPSSGPKATLLVQDQINTAIAQALSQVNLGTQASEEDDSDPEEAIEPKKGTTFRHKTRTGRVLHSSQEPDN
jgi:hypothetical protein